MKRMIFFLLVLIIIGCKPSKYLQQDYIQLSKPHVTISEVFFENNTTISVGPTAKGAKVEYSISGSENKVYQEPIDVTEPSEITIQAIGGGYMPSSMVHFEVIQMPSVKNNSILSNRPLNDKYGQGGLGIIIDIEKGQSNFENGWLGYLGDTVDFTIAFDEREVDQVTVSTLKNHGAWIFSPQKINIYDNEIMITTQYLASAKSMEENASVFTKITFPKIKTNQLKVEIIALEKIPAWHPGKGSKPWMFIDEILIY